MIRAQRSRVNQKLHQASLLLQAAGSVAQDEMNQLAWQQACLEAAVLALDAARLAFLRELAAIYRLDVRAVQQATDLRRLAADREQVLPELDAFEAAFREPGQPLALLGGLLKDVNRIPAASDSPAAGDWMPEFNEPVPTATRIPLLDAAQVDEPISRETQQLVVAARCHQALKSLIQSLREQLHED